MTPRARNNLVRAVIAIAVIGGVVWYLKGRKSDAAHAGATFKGEGSGSGSGSGFAFKKGGSDSKGEGGGSADRVVSVQVATAEKTDLPVWLEGLGTVAAFQQVTIKPQVDGRLDKVLFKEGQAVKAGDVLAQIDPRPFLVQLHEAQGALARDKAQEDAAKKNYERYKGLAAQQLVAQQQVEEIGAQAGQYAGAVKIDQAQIESAQLQLDYATVKSPIDGITGVRLVDAGNLVKASDTTGLVVITQIDPAAILFTIPQDRLAGIAAAVAKGKVPVEVWNRDGSVKLATGELAVLDNQINQATSTLRLKAIAPNPGRLLWPNAFVKAKILIETRANAVVVPAVAIQRGPSGTFVYVVDANKTAQMVPVTVGLMTAGKSVIEKGLSGGEDLVIEGQNQLRPGGKVEPSRPGDEGKKPARGPAEKATGPTAKAP